MLGLLLLAFILILVFIYGISYFYGGGGGTLFSRPAYVLSSQKYTLSDLTQNPPQTLPSFPTNYPGTVPAGTYQTGTGWVHWEGAVHTPNQYAVMSVSATRGGQHIHITEEPASQRAFPFYYQA